MAPDRLSWVPFGMAVYAQDLNVLGFLVAKGLVVQMVEVASTNIC